MASRCKHRNVTGAIVVRMFAAGGTFADSYLKECAARICQDCGAWLSLGPSNDDDPGVAIEIEAARLAAVRADGGSIPHSAIRPGHRGCAGCGWNLDGRYAPGLDGRFRTDAGYLARCIAQHGDEG